MDEQSKKEQLLMQRLDANHTKYYNSLSKMNEISLIQYAPEIVAVTDTYEYMKHDKGYELEELDYWLAFENPLSIAYDAVIAARDGEKPFVEAVVNRLAESKDYLDGSDYTLAKPHKDKSMER